MTFAHSPWSACDSAAMGCWTSDSHAQACAQLLPLTLLSGFVSTHAQAQAQEQQTSLVQQLRISEAARYQSELWYAQQLVELEQRLERAEVCFASRLDLLHT